MHGWVTITNKSLFDKKLREFAKTVVKKFIPLVERGPILLKKDIIFLQQTESADPCRWIVGSTPCSVAPLDGVWSVGVL